MGLHATTSDDKPHPLWIVLQKQQSFELAAFPFFPHYVPDEPWMYLKDAMVELPQTEFSKCGHLRGIKDILGNCLTIMRGSAGDMLPAGWKLADMQSLSSVDFGVLERMECDHFIAIGRNVFSKDFAYKAQAMKPATKSPSFSTVFRLIDFFSIRH